ncbi:MAG TPA: GNAT family N-acetyltransferase [Chitinophagaceae bacterium]|nr:GNAT family N-acetyltransferase [Chitinophagaceae bacterium]
MSKSVYIRPLQLADAQVSYQWRNNPKIWRFTGARPDKYITPEMEASWIMEVMKRDNERRFAICLAADNRYIGNIYFTDILKDEAQMHIFIGDTEYWGKRRAYESICQIFDYGFKILKLNIIYVQINPRNAAAMMLSKLVAFKRIGSSYEATKDIVLEKMIFTRSMYRQKHHLSGGKDKAAEK